jgi:hypothetical protein
MPDEFIFPLKRKFPEELCGHPPDQFEYPPPSEFICFICQKVVKKPMECLNCGKLCCDVCIFNSLLTTDSSQPKTFKCKLCNTTKEPRKPSQLLLRMISELKIKCKNFDQGCCTYVSLNEGNKHEATCAFTEIHCRNYAECKSIGLIKNFIEIEGNSRSLYAPLAARTRGKAFVCSERCRLIGKFENFLHDRQHLKALNEFLEVLKR